MGTFQTLFLEQKVSKYLFKKMHWLKCFKEPEMYKNQLIMFSLPFFARHPSQPWTKQPNKFGTNYMKCYLTKSTNPQSFPFFLPFVQWRHRLLLKNGRERKRSPVFKSLQHFRSERFRVLFLAFSRNLWSFR